VDFGKRRDAVIPFEQGRGFAGALDGALVQFPDGVNDGMVVRVQDIFFKFAVAGDVDLGDATGGDPRSCRPSCSRSPSS